MRTLWTSDKSEKLERFHGNRPTFLGSAILPLAQSGLRYNGGGMSELYWLPEVPDWRARVFALASAGQDDWVTARQLAEANLNFTRTNMLDTAFRQALASRSPASMLGKPVRLALLGSCTTSHLHAAIRVAGLRRDIPIEIYEPAYGQYWQELVDPGSDLHRFGPDTVLFALDSHHLSAGAEVGASKDDADQYLAATTSRIQTCWRLAREAFHCPILHQTALPVHPPLIGMNEYRLAGSPARFLARLNQNLRALSDAAGVDLLDLEVFAASDGVRAWHDTGLWLRSKQEIAPSAAPMYGELVVRLIGAKQGRSRKALVLDLDNTLWGGVIGDDGLDGLVLGQGSALGEAFVAFQSHARALARRGVILAVCSKNEVANALEPFEKHPEMVLRRSDIACFVANWHDKAANIRDIAVMLNIGLDSLVFVDDNPAERALVRQELPMVAVPEVGDDPATFGQTLADAGYFETLAVTEEDFGRGRLYQSSAARTALRQSNSDLPSYLRGLSMRLIWRRFDQLGLARIVQLINKTNQFNLTGRRYAEDAITAVMADARALGLQLRLTDQFGDNGIIAIVIGRLLDDGDLVIDTWLMSCRVLGRNVEACTLNLLVEQARSLGACRLVGDYVPTAKNDMVKNHYARLGFEVATLGADGASRNILDLAGFAPTETHIDVREG